MNGTKILIITNDINHYQDIEIILRQENFLTFVATSEQIGLQLAKQNLPDLILCELKTSNLDGYQILAQLRQDCATVTIPLIFLTDDIEREKWRKAMEMGADDFLLKPFEASELVKAIAARLSKKAALVSKWEQELEQIRHNIAYFMPHELRTPLTGILAASDLLLTKIDSLDLSVVREMISCINASSQRLNRLVQNTLLYSELELISQEKEQIEYLRAEETNLAKTVIEEVAVNISKKNNRQTDLYLELEDASVQIGKTHLAKIAEELIDNACKFSPQGTPITVKTRVDKERFIFCVKDCGRGMNAQQIASIGAYIQFDRSFHEQQGSGLGLAIAKQLTQIHGGLLIVDSILSGGTNVSILLPLVQHHSSYLRRQSLNADKDCSKASYQIN
jgi:signal transduction histidine kinase